MTYYVKQGDTLPTLDVTVVSDTDGSVVDLSAATSVVFRMRSVNAKPSGAFKVNAAAAFVVKAAGTMRYTWQVGDTDTPGSYAGEFVITYPAGVQTVPTRGCLDVIVEDSGLPGPVTP